MGKDFEVYEGLQAKPNTAGFKDTSKRLRQGKESRLGHRTSLDWRLDRTNVCKKNPASKMVAIEDLTDILLKSRTANSISNHEKMQNIVIVYDEQSMPSQLYVTPEHTVIALNPNRPKGELVNTLAKELRRAWQQSNGTLINPMGFEPDEAILVNRSQQSDVLVTAIKIAWELNLVGESESWDYMTASSMASISRSFETEARKDFRTLNNGEASRKAYDEFFGKNHSKVFDRKVIHQMLLDDKGYMKVADKKSLASIDFFSRLGEMPFSSNYMFIGSKKAMPNDPSYYKVEDRSNANSLWFVKFERNFQSKEIKMVEDVVKASAKIVDFTAARAARPSFKGMK